MKYEYDFSKGERGKFFRGETTLVPPIHLDPHPVGTSEPCDKSPSPQWRED
jgi:hypothetical protein